MNKPTVIFDCDDTLGNLKDRLENIYRTETGNQLISSNDWKDYNSIDRYGISSDQLTGLFYNDKTLENIVPHDGISEISHTLRDLGYNIEIVTARAWHDRAYEITEKWLNDNNFAYDRINIVPLTQCKEEATRHIENIKLFIDDRFDHCLNMWNSGRVETCLVYSQPWNIDNFKTISTQNIHSIKTLYEIMDHL